MNVSMIVAVSVCFAAAASMGGVARAEESRSRSALEIRQSVDGLLSAESAAATSAERVAAIRDMIALSREIAAHPSLGKHTAASLRGRLAGRLKRVADELTASVKPKADDALLAQRLGGAPFVANQAANDSADGGEALADAIQDTIAPPTWERNGGLGVIVAFGPQGRGGNALFAQVPPQGNNRAGRGGPARVALAADVSAELVDLIQQVVAPQSWDVNGGAGAVIFFAPINALIVRQTEEVHEALFDVVGRIRRNP
ncbi:MAG: hypothetical protein WD875_01020 [Pirellulales bacterium]